MNDVNIETNIDKKNSIINYTQSLKVEYFDERYYKIGLPENFNPAKLKYPNLYTESDEGKFIYLPSVTTYLSYINEPQLNQWRGEVGNEYADYKMHKAANLGSDIHRAINMRCSGYDVIYQNPKHETISEANIKQYALEINPKIYIIDSQDVAVQLARFEKFIEQIEATILETEMIVYSLKYLYAGQLDLIIELKKDVSFKSGRSEYELKKGKYIIDIKTGKNVNELKYYSQLSAYANATNIKGLKGVIILHTNANIKSGIEGLKVYYKDKKEMKSYFNYFRYIQNAFLFSIKDFKVTNYNIPIFFNSQLQIKLKGN